uniref:Uncharacterized protein n=1 Tax=Parascaris equorum TaxID=6256 RepID=A0A914SB27_PAREQ
LPLEQHSYYKTFYPVHCQRSIRWLILPIVSDAADRRRRLLVTLTERFEAETIGRDTSHGHIAVEVHEEDVDKARPLNTEESRETLPQNNEVLSADQQEVAADSPKQLEKKDSL